VAKNDAAGTAFTIRSRARRCALTASAKYSVSIAVVRRANAGILLAESKPTTEAALDAGRSHRIFCGTPRASKVLAMIGSGIAHATASATWNVASAAYVFGEFTALMSLIQFGRRREGALYRLARIGLGLRHRLNDRRVGLGGEPVGHVVIVLPVLPRLVVDR
jgi:hypothetical protein